MSFKPRKHSAKKEADVINNLSDRCHCGDRNGHHTRAEAIRCDMEKREPWHFSVEKDKMKKNIMRFDP